MGAAPLGAGVAGPEAADRYPRIEVLAVGVVAAWGCWATRSGVPDMAAESTAESVSVSGRWAGSPLTAIARAARAGEAAA